MLGLESYNKGWWADWLFGLSGSGCYYCFSISSIMKTRTNCEILQTLGTNSVNFWNIFPRAFVVIPWFLEDHISLFFKLCFKDHNCQTLKLQGLNLPNSQSFFQGPILNFLNLWGLQMIFWAIFDHFASPATAFDLFPISCSFLSVLACFRSVFTYSYLHIHKYKNMHSLGILG